MEHIYFLSDKFCRLFVGIDHSSDVIIGATASQITSLTIVLSKHRSKETSKLRVTGVCAGISPGTGEIPAQMTSYAENVSIWWRHHDIFRLCRGPGCIDGLFSCKRYNIDMFSTYWCARLQAMKEYATFVTPCLIGRDLTQPYIYKTDQWYLGSTGYI